MKIENIAWISLAARRSTKEQGQSPISHRVLRKIIENNQDVFAFFHPFFGHRHARERRDVLLGRRLRSRSINNRHVIETVFGFELGDERSDRRIFLADRDVNAVHAFALLIHDRIDCNRGFSRLTVADDEFPLAPADRDHRIDGLDAGFKRGINAFARHNARSDSLNRTRLGIRNWP